MIDTKSLVKNSQLGKTTEYTDLYNPDLLFPIPRAPKRTELGITSSLPFSGYDIWNAYELSWLNQKGKPQVAIAEIIIPCNSPNIIESKSMKLYFNSINNTHFSDIQTLADTIETDLSKMANSPIQTNLTLLFEAQDIRTESFSGRCIDDIDIEINTYQLDPFLLRTEETMTNENLYTNLFKSNCLATGQPDWASIRIQYQGKKIDEAALLRYLVSYRNHQEFHEQCVERIFMDLQKHCQPTILTVEARFTRRGGLDINPIRSTQQDIKPTNRRQIRQ